MNPSLLIRLRPVTPWRIGSDSGERAEAEAVLHSDALFSAVTLAMGRLGLLEEWLDATTSGSREPAVRFTSVFPWQREHLFVPPPAGMWPPAGVAGKVRWKGARLIPVSLLGAVLRRELPAEEEWAVDGHSGCLIPNNPRFPSGPFRFVRRTSVAVDRLNEGVVAPHEIAFIQFTQGSGVWCAAQFSNQQTYAVWGPKVEAAFRFLADDGIGAWRSRGFGRSRRPEFQAGQLETLLMPEGPGKPANPRFWWMLSLFSPGPSDSIEWGAGDYSLLTRQGRTAAGELKLASRMVREGAVVGSSNAPVGGAQNVAPTGSAHPAFRAGFAVSLPIAWREAGS